MKSLIRIENKEACCGCGACVQICPKQCITLKPDREGFLYPEADTQRCVDCGLCERVCPVASAESSERVPPCYAARSNDQGLRQESSSGGVFSLLAEAALEQGGRVYGAAFDSRMQVCHIAIGSRDELGKLRGSKYVQSRIGDTFVAVKRDLQAGKTVLFSGTACQIAGLNAFLGKEYPNLYTVDVLCHGVPSPMVWEKYLRWQQRRHGNSPICGVSMRSKESGWRKYSLRLDFTDGKHYSRSSGYDVFMKLFLEDKCLRPSCHDCCFKALDRPSDLTLGDAWGIEKILPDMDDDKGTSLIFVHSERGEALLGAVAPRMEYRQVDGEKALPPTAYSRRSAPRHPERDRFFDMINSPGWEKMLSGLEVKSRLQMVKNKVRVILKGK